MKDLKHIKRFNESDENLNISDVRSSKINELFGGQMKDSIVPMIDRVINKLETIKDEMTDNKRGTYNREDMIKIEFIDGLIQGKDMKLLLKSYEEQMKHRFH
jgi:hypothetical protein